MDCIQIYKILKASFGTESYLFNVKIGLCEYFLPNLKGLLKLECNVGRYNNIHFQERLLSGTDSIRSHILPSKTKGK